MIFIDNDNTLGSALFTQQVAELITPVMAQLLDDDAFEDFELGLLQDMLHLGDLSDDGFSVVLDAIRTSKDIDADWQQLLIERMQSDSRYDQQNNPVAS